MNMSRGWKAWVRAAPVWVIPLAALVLTVSLVFLCVPALEAAWGGSTGAAAAPKPVTLAARFVQWGATTTYEGPCLTMTVVPDTEDKTPLTVNIPTTKKENGAVEPPDAVKSLGGQLRVSDEVELTYVKAGTALKYCAASAKGSADPKRDEATVFTFVARRTVALRGKQVEAVTVGRGAATWTFLLPDADPKDEAYQPDAGLLKKVKECRRGNTVRLTYDPAEFVFWLRDIEITKPADDKKASGNAPGGEKKAQDAPAAADKTVQAKGASPPAAKP